MNFAFRGLPGVIIVASLTLGGCSPPLGTSNHVYSPVLREPDGTVRAVHSSIGRSSQHSHRWSSSVSAKSRVRKFFLQKTTPYVGSAEWEEEQAQAKRRELEIRRSIEGICRRC
jgi:hypothetical protein